MEDLRPNTAGDLRRHYRSQSRTDIAIGLIGNVADLLAEQGLPSGGPALLAATSQQLGASHAALLGYAAGRLHCIAGTGAAPGRGTRLSPSAAMQAALQWPPSVLRQAPVQRPWLCFTAPLGFEWLVPCPLDGKVVGIAMWAGPAGISPPPHVEDRTLLRLGSLLAAALQAGGKRERRRSGSPASARELARLTPREQQVMSLLPRGYSNAQIGHALGIATGTAKIHVERILRKLQLQDRAQAAARAVELQLGDSE